METKGNEGKGGFLQGIVQFWKGLKKPLRWSIIGVLAALIIVILVLSFSTPEEEYEILYTGLSAEQATSVYGLLTELNIPYKLHNSDTVMVKKGTRDEVNLQLMSAGYPQADVDYSLLQQAAGLGTTDLEKKEYIKYQTQQYLAYMIKRMDKVENATVMVTLAQTSQFALSDTGNTPAQASVLLELKDGQMLTTAEAEAVRSLVVQGVAGLEPENVTIADSNLNVYRQYTGDYTSSAGDRLTYTKQMEDLLKEKLFNLLSPVFGPANITTAVNVELDFDKHSTESITYTPPGNAENMGIIVSLRQTAELVGGATGAQGTAGFDSNGAAPYYPEVVQSAGADSSSYSYEVNAELNEVHDSIEKAQGVITGLSVSVIIDANEEWDAYLDDIRQQIATAIGVDDAYISLMRTSFKVNEELQAMVDEQIAQQESAAADEQAALEAERQKQLILIGAAAAGVVLIMVLIMVLSARKRKRQHQEEIARLEAEHAAELQAQIDHEQELIQQNAIEDMGEENQGVLSQLQELADNNPSAIAQLLRNWLSDDFR